MNVSFKTHKHINDSTLYIQPSCPLWCGWMLNNSDARPEISFKLFLDLQDKTHFSVSNSWISANGKMCHAVSYSNTFTGLVKLAPVSVGWHWTQLHGQPEGGVELLCPTETTIGWSTGQRLSVNTARICGQPLGMRQLFCVWILDRPTLLLATFCSLIPIMPPWTGAEAHRGG